MTPVLVLLAGLVTAGAVAAVTAATPRAAILGLLVALAGAAYVADPLADPIGLAVRLAGTTLGTYLVWISLRDAPGAMPVAGAGRIGTAAIALAAFVSGWLCAGTLATVLGSGSAEGPGAGGIAVALAAGSFVPRAALGAAFALVAVALPPVVLARDALRLGVGLLLMLAAAGLVANALVGQVDNVVELSMAILTAAVGAGVAAVIAGSIRHGGDLVLRDSLRPEAAIRHRAADDAHRRPAP